MIRPHYVPEGAHDCGIPRRRLAGELLWCYGTQSHIRTIYADPKSRHPRAARKRRRVAPLPEWLRFLPHPLQRRADNWAQDICDLMNRMAVRHPLPMTPASLALRLYGMSLTRIQAFMPRDVIIGSIRCSERRGAGPLYVLPPIAPAEIPQVWVYDINQAYAHHLAHLPEIEEGTGVWYHVRQYAGPWGIYHLLDGRSESGTYIDGDHALEYLVDGGWVWRSSYSNEPWGRPVPKGPLGTQTSFQVFLSRLTLASGASPPRIRPLIKRLPVLFVGKCFQHDQQALQERLIWRTIGYCYPPVWTWVTGRLRRQVEEIELLAGPIVHGFVDAMHLRRPLPPEMVSDQEGEPGKWKLLAHGPGRYLGLNCFVVGDFFRHQGIDGPEESARAQFEMMWGRRRSA